MAVYEGARPRTLGLPRTTRAPRPQRVAQAPTRIALPGGWQPEGIAANGSQLFVGWIPTGAVYSVSSRTGRGRVLVRGRNGRAAIGLKVAGNRLWVAGGGTGRAFIYSVSSGQPVNQP